MVPVERAGESREKISDRAETRAGARITNIGHATLLIEIGGVRVLTDPNFDRRLAGVLRRVSPPGIALTALPPLDAVLLSHAHADHLSYRSLDALPRGIPILAPPRIARRLRRRGYHSALGLAPREMQTVGSVRIHADQARHRVSGGANMYLLDASEASVFFAGDTGLTPNTHEMAAGRRIDVALLPIGNAPWWRPGFRRGHLSSDDALVLFERLGARYLIPYHWGTFHHVTSGPFTAKRRLDTLLKSHPRRDDVIALPPGTTCAL
jgi:L-ascorbate metabolism protein UlaG (beta-lactamase superfamily)